MTTHQLLIMAIHQWAYVRAHGWAVPEHCRTTFLRYLGRLDGKHRAYSRASLRFFLRHRIGPRRWRRWMAA